MDSRYTSDIKRFSKNVVNQENVGNNTEQVDEFSKNVVDGTDGTEIHIETREETSDVIDSEVAVEIPLPSLNSERFKFFHIISRQRIIKISLSKKLVLT